MQVLGERTKQGNWWTSVTELSTLALGRQTASKWKRNFCRSLETLERRGLVISRRARGANHRAVKEFAIRSASRRLRTIAGKGRCDILVTCLHDELSVHLSDKFVSVGEHPHSESAKNLDSLVCRACRNRAEWELTSEPSSKWWLCGKHFQVVLRSILFGFETIEEVWVSVGSAANQTATF